MSDSIDISSGADRSPPAGGFARWRQTMLTRGYILPIVSVTVVVCTWFVTLGDWTFVNEEYFCSFYDAQARSILHGRLDVPRPAVGFEGFFRDGKAYCYFGIAPALLRVPLVLLLPDWDGHWSRLFMLAGVIVNIICAYRLLLLLQTGDGPPRPLNRVLNSLFVLCAGLGSTSVLLCARSYTYHEAIMLGSAFALLFALAFLRYLNEPSVGRLVVAGALAFMSFHSRTTAGAGAVLCLGVLTAALCLRVVLHRPIGASWFGLPLIGHPGRHAIAGLTAVSLIVATYFAVNYGKFHTFSGVPLQYYELFQKSPERMLVTGGRQIHPENLPTGIASYFCVGFNIRGEFPWAFLTRRPLVIGSPAIDLVEPFSSIPASMPGLFIFAVLGLRPVVHAKTEIYRRLRLPVVSLFIGGSAIVLMTVGITQRYVHDFYPFLVVAGAAGVARLALGTHARAAVATFSMLTLISILLSLAFAIEFQRFTVWGIPQHKRREFIHFREAIDRVLHHQTIPVPEEQ